MKEGAAPFEKNIKTVDLPAVRLRHFRILRSPLDSNTPGVLVIVTLPLDSEIEIFAQRAPTANRAAHLNC